MKAGYNDFMGKKVVICHLLCYSYVRSCQRIIDRKENGTYLSKNFEMRDPYFTTIYTMANLDFTNTDSHKMDFNTAVKDNWQEASEAQD